MFIIQHGNIMCLKSKMTPNQTKILEGMDKVYDKLIEFKKKMNSELVILKDNKITRVKP